MNPGLRIFPGTANDQHKSIMRRTNQERVEELNEILGPVREKTGYHFSLLKNARNCVHPYCLCYSWEIKRSLGFKEMKAMAIRMREAYDKGGDRMSVYKAIYAD